MLRPGDVISYNGFTYVISNIDDGKNRASYLMFNERLKEGVGSVIGNLNGFSGYKFLFNIFNEGETECT